MVSQILWKVLINFIYSFRIWKSEINNILRITLLLWFWKMFQILSVGRNASLASEIYFWRDSIQYPISNKISTYLHNIKSQNVCRTMLNHAQWELATLCAFHPVQRSTSSVYYNASAKKFAKDLLKNFSILIKYGSLIFSNSRHFTAQSWIFLQSLPNVYRSLWGNVSNKNL